jgi:hypothetical protein
MGVGCLSRRLFPCDQDQVFIFFRIVDKYAAQMSWLNDHHSSAALCDIPIDRAVAYDLVGYEVDLSWFAVVGDSIPFFYLLSGLVKEGQFNLTSTSTLTPSARRS